MELLKEKNGSKYLTFASKNKNEKVLHKYIEFWNKIKNLAEKINDKPGKYEKDYSYDNLPLKKILKLHNLKIIVRSVFEENGKYYPPAFLDECLYE